MPITLITGPANAGKARAVLDAVTRHAALGEQPLLVLPTGVDADRYRRELAQEGPVTGVSVCLFGGLLERVAQRAAVEDPTLAPAPMSAGAREQMLCTLAIELLPSAGQGRRLAQALSGAIAELRAADLRPERVRCALGPAIAAGELRARLLAELYERYSQVLARHGLIDAELRARRALDVLRVAPRLWHLNGRPTPVLLYGFDDLTALELDAVETLGCSVEAPVTVSLAYEGGRVAFAGRSWAFQELLPRASSHIELPARSDHYAPVSRMALHRLERRLFEADEHEEIAEGAGESELAWAEPGGQLSLMESQPSTLDRPALTSTEGVSLWRCGSPQEEAELIAMQARELIDGGVAPEEIAIVHRAPATAPDALSEALDAAGVGHAARRLARFADTALGRALIGLLACGCEGMARCEVASLSDLLAWLRAPGHLQRVELADRLEEQALHDGISDAARARTLWEREHWPLERIDRVREAAQRGPEALLERAERELMRLFCAPRAGTAAVLDPAGETAPAMQAGRARIAELWELACVAPDMVGGAAGVIDALRQARLPKARLASASAVAVIDPLALRARRVRVLFVCGLQEGVFPATGRPDPVFSEELRSRVAAVCGPRLARRQDSLAAERYLLYATVSRPQEKLFLSWHATAEDGSGTPPSLFLEDVCDAFAGSLCEQRPERGGQGTDGGATGGLKITPAASSIRGRAGATAAAEMRGLADRRVLAELRERRLWSASSLERWSACPVSWLIERMLRAESLDPEPEPRARGALAHAVLGEIFASLEREVGSARITPTSLPQADALMRQALRRHERELPLSVAPERALAARRRLEADLRRYLDHAAEQNSPLEPAHLEVSFGLNDQADALPALELADEVLLCGRIDRVDVGQGGEAVIYDYKSGRTGSDYSGAKWIESGRFQMALYMRAVEGLMGLRPVGGLYQPLAGPDLRARGALADDAGLALSFVRTDGYDSAELGEMVTAVCNVAAEAAHQAQAGEIEPRPQTCAYGGGCMYPTICRCGR